MRWMLLFVVLAGCSDGTGGGDDGAMCEPVEGGAPCCDLSFDVVPDDCPNGAALDVDCWLDNGSGADNEPGCEGRAGRIVASKVCRDATGRPVGPYVSYSGDGALANYREPDRLRRDCYPSGLEAWRIQFAADEDSYCYEACFSEAGRPVDCATISSTPGYCPGFSAPHE